MTRFESPGIASVIVPQGADISAAVEVCRIEAEPGDAGEGVSATRINRNPSATAAFAVTEKITRRERLV
jgi:hypothetical protein